MLHDGFRGSCIRTVGYLDPFPGWAQNHFRHKCHFPGFNDFSALQTAPVFLFYSKADSLVYLEFTSPVNHNTIAIAHNVMVHPERLDPKAIEPNSLLRLCKLQTVDYKRKLRCDHPKGRYHPGKSFGSDQQKRLCALCISHGEKHSRQSADMIRMKVRKADHINRLGAPALFL